MTAYSKISFLKTLESNRLSLQLISSFPNIICRKIACIPQSSHFPRMCMVNDVKKRKHTDQLSAIRKSRLSLLQMFNKAELFIWITKADTEELVINSNQFKLRENNFLTVSSFSRVNKISLSTSNTQYKNPCFYDIPFHFPSFCKNDCHLIICILWFHFRY